MHFLLPLQRQIRIPLCGLLCMVCSSQSVGQVYTGVSSTGVVTLSSFQSESASVLLLRADPVAQPAQVRQYESVPKGSKLRPRKREALVKLVDSVGKAVGVSPDLIHAVISAESNYDVQALSPRGAMGLMQLMPATALRFGAANPYLEHDNVYAGARYLKWLMGYFDGNLELVLAAYNAGEGAVVKAGLKVPRFAETEAYVQRVMTNMKRVAKPGSVDG
jgi:soluble lytic murein transglycosylase-like protein